VLEEDTCCLESNSSPPGIITSTTNRVTPILPKTEATFLAIMIFGAG